MQYLENIPITSASEDYTLVKFVDDLLERVAANIASNAIVIPIFQSFNLLLEADILSRLGDDDGGRERYGPSSTQSTFLRPLTEVPRLQKLCSNATRNVTKWKNVERINEAMKMYASLLLHSVGCTDRT